MAKRIIVHLLPINQKKKFRPPPSPRRGISQNVGKSSPGGEKVPAATPFASLPFASKKRPNIPSSAPRNVLSIFSTSFVGSPAEGTYGEQIGDEVAKLGKAGGGGITMHGISGGGIP